MAPELTVLDCLLGGDPAEVCGEPYCATVTFACVHEHIGAARICSGCALEVQMLAGSHTCLRCEDGGPESHECRCRVVITWDDKTASDTIVQEAADGR